MRYLICLFTLISIITFNRYASGRLCRQKQLKIAIVDSGLDLNDPRFQGHICKDGHTTFVENSIDDFIGHGTHVAGLILKYAGDGNYCFMIYKYYSEANPGSVNLRNLVRAFDKAVRDGADIVNYSGGGPEFNEAEYLAIKSHPEVIFVVAAGNDGKNIDIIQNHFYPASYNLKNMIVVGNLMRDGKKNPSSNFGKSVNIWENGTLALSSLPGTNCEKSAFKDIPKNLANKLIREHTNIRILDGCNGFLTGTSMATAIHTGKLVANKKITCDSE